jgi:hypothetical protein
MRAADGPLGMWQTSSRIELELGRCRTSPLFVIRLCKPASEDLVVRRFPLPDRGNLDEVQAGASFRESRVR